jgi:branched-chain amino acid transport system substrate-binding protein
MRGFLRFFSPYRVMFACGLVATSLVVAACGSSSSSSSNSSSVSSGSSSTGSTTSSSASQASLGPIKVGNISDVTGPVPLPYGAQGANAFFDKINAAGGINGRKINLIVEDDQLDPVKSAQAARTLNSDGVVALVADESLASCTTNGKYFGAVNLRDIYAGGAELACFKTPNISPINVGPLGDWLITEQFVAKTFPADKSAVCAFQTNTGTANPYHTVANNYAKKVFGGSGFKYVNNTLDANSDISALMVTAKQHGCNVLMSDEPPTQTAAFVNDAKTQGYTPHFVFQGAQYSPQLAQALPHTPAGSLYSIAELEPFTDNAPVVNQMKADLTAAHVGINGLTEFGWQAARTFYNIVKTIKGSINRDSVNAALQAATNVDTGGMTATPYVFGKGSSHFSNQSGKIVELVNGKWLTVGPWVTIPPGAIASS